MDDKFKVVAYVKLVNKHETEDDKSTLSVEVEKVNIILNDDIVGNDPEFNIEITGVTE